MLLLVFLVVMGSLCWKPSEDLPGSQGFAGSGPLGLLSLCWAGMESVGGEQRVTSRLVVGAYSEPHCPEAHLFDNFVCFYRFRNNYYTVVMIGLNFVAFMFSGVFSFLVL